MKELDVQIINGKKPCWYHSLKGMVFRVYDNRRDYILKEDYDLGHHAMWRHISKPDVLVVRQV